MCNQVHGERAILLVLLYLDIRIRASILSNIVGCDLFDFCKKLLLAILRHLLVANSKAKLLLIRLLGLQLDHTIVIFNAILQLHGRWRRGLRLDSLSLRDAAGLVRGWDQSMCRGLLWLFVLFMIRSILQSLFAIGRLWYIMWLAIFVLIRCRWFVLSVSERNFIEKTPFTRRLFHIKRFAIFVLLLCCLLARWVSLKILFELIRFTSRFFRIRLLDIITLFLCYLLVLFLFVCLTSKLSTYPSKWPLDFSEKTFWR